MVENTLSVVEEGTSSILEGQLLSVDQVASVIVTTEKETSAPQGQSAGSSWSPSTKESMSFIVFYVVQCVFYSF